MSQAVCVPCLRCLHTPSNLATDKPLRHAFIDTCIAPVISEIVAVNAPSYMKLLKLDKTVRDFNVPPTPSPQELVAKPSLVVDLQSFSLNGYKDMSGPLLLSFNAS